MHAAESNKKPCAGLRAILGKKTRFPVCICKPGLVTTLQNDGRSLDRIRQFFCDLLKIHRCGSGISECDREKCVTHFDEFFLNRFGKKKIVTT